MTNLSLHFCLLSKNLQMWPHVWTFCSFICLNAQLKSAVFCIISPPPMHITQLCPMARVCLIPSVWNLQSKTKLERSPSFPSPVPLANAWPTSVGKNQPSNISQDLCLGTDNNFVTRKKSRIHFWCCSFRKRGHSQSTNPRTFLSLFYSQVLSLL